MRLEPTRSWINAIAMVHKKQSPIIAPDATSKSTRCYLIEAVGPQAAEQGFAVGDLVIAKTVYDLFFYGGAYHRVKFVAEEVMDIVRDPRLDEFVLLDGETAADTIDPAVSAQEIAA